MKLNNKSRFEITKKLAEEIKGMGQTNGTLFLKTYTGLKHKEVEGKFIVRREDMNNSWNEVEFDYNKIVTFVSSLEDTVIIKMFQDQFPDEYRRCEKEFSEGKPSRSLSSDKLVLFFSHSHEDKKLVSDLKKVLEKTDWIECFVAHQDISPNEEWKEEIKKYLENCHCLIVFLSENFKSSDWCNQEIGYAVKRGIPIFPVKLDKTDPYGFISHIQANTLNPEKNIEKLSEEIKEDLLKHENLFDTAYEKLKEAVERLKYHFLYSSNRQMAASALDQLMSFQTGQIENQVINEIEENWKQNNHIKEIEDIDSKMKEFFKKHPNRESSKQKENNNSHTNFENVEKGNERIPETNTFPKEPTQNPPSQIDFQDEIPF